MSKILLRKSFPNVLTFLLSTNLGLQGRTKRKLLSTQLLRTLDVLLCFKKGIYGPKSEHKGLSIYTFSMLYLTAHIGKKTD